MIGDGSATAWSPTIGDIRDAGVVRKAIDDAQPSVIFHLAAQPLVSRSFDEPLDTYASNVMGTANVLDAASRVPSVRAVVCITTDKVYQDQDWHWGYRENDTLGGKDPYAASKACAELVAQSYRMAMAPRRNGVLIATARGGNIVGGGDWSRDRIIPDFVRAVVSRAPLKIRHPEAVRPWQHVLALVHGYLLLASGMLQGRRELADGWNFGPSEKMGLPVRGLIDLLGRAWELPQIVYETGQFPETRLLNVDSTKARSLLDWRPPITVEETVTMTAEWYRGYYAASDVRAMTLAQIDAYRRLLNA